VIYYPAIGWTSYFQSLRIAIYHDAHHFKEIERAISPVEGGDWNAEIII
jgi:hypothetical protein